jgi:hypothetical protein
MGNSRVNTSSRANRKTSWMQMPTTSGMKSSNRNASNSRDDQYLAGTHKILGKFYENYLY